MASVPLFARANGSVDPAPQSVFASPPVIMAPRADGIEVVWAVHQWCRGWVEIRTNHQAVRRITADDFGFVAQGDSVLRVRIQDLNPGTTYELRAVLEVADESKTREASPWKSFRTLDPNAGESHFVVWNDTHEHVETLRRLHEVSPAADFLLWNGDTCNDWHRENQLVSTLLHPAGQDITAGRPMILSWGNHDVRGKFAFKVRDMIATPDGRPFCAFRSGPIACLVLHTGEDKPDNHPSFAGRVAFEPLRQEQKTWLHEVIGKPEIRDAPYKIVFCHIPLRWTDEPDSVDYQNGYDRYARASRDAWHESLTAWGAQIIISGHTHRDAWIPADDAFPYGQLIGGGPRPDGARWIEGVANASGLHLVMRDLDGKVIHDLTLPQA